MALTLSEVGFSTVQAIHGGEGRRRTVRINSVVGTTEMRRRGLLLSLSVTIASSVAAAPQIDDPKASLLKKYLKKSQDNKAKNDKERLDAYYKRNYKDYFGFIEGSLKGKEDQLSESEKVTLVGGPCYYGILRVNGDPTDKSL